MSKPKVQAAPAPPQPEAPAAKVLLGAEDTPIAAVKKRTAQRSSLRFLSEPTPGVGVQL